MVFQYKEHIFFSLPGWTGSYIFGYLNAKFQVLKSIGSYPGFLHTCFYCISGFEITLFSLSKLWNSLNASSVKYLLLSRWLVTRLFTSCLILSRSSSSLFNRWKQVFDWRTSLTCQLLHSHISAHFQSPLIYKCNKRNRTNFIAVYLTLYS